MGLFIKFLKICNYPDYTQRENNMMPKTYQRINRGSLRLALTQTLAEFASDGNDNPYEINNGLCSDFCNDVCDHLGGENFPIIYGVDIHAMKDYYRYFECEFDVAHVALFCESEGDTGRFYDAECIEGVDHWLDLPLCVKAFANCGRPVGKRQAQRRYAASGI